MSVTWSGGPSYGIKAFTGREWDPETGLYYYRARYYDPGAGRFSGSDPRGMVDGTNLYRYVHNNPVVFVDPYGNTANVGKPPGALLSNVDDYDMPPTAKAEMFNACRSEGEGYVPITFELWVIPNYPEGMKDREQQAIYRYEMLGKWETDFKNACYRSTKNSDLFERRGACERPVWGSPWCVCCQRCKKR
jgi:RHS repeat-associated protein